MANLPISRKTVRPVAHSVIGAFVWWLLTLGGGLVSSYYTAHSAYLQGLPAYKAIPLGAVTFLVLSFAFYVLTLTYTAWLQRRELTDKKSQLTSATQGALQTTELQEDKKTAEDARAALDESQKDGRAWERKYWKEHNGNIPIRNLNETYEGEIKALTANLKTAQSDAKEARREKLDAESNLQGVERDRNNYRTWFNELAWLKKTVEDQAKDISNHVSLVTIRPCVLDLKERFAVIELVFRNTSLFDITIEANAISGRFSTGKKGLLEDPVRAIFDIDHPPIKGLKPLQEATLVVMQPLLKSEAEDISDAVSAGGDSSFWIGNLDIPISADKVPQEVEPKRLRIGHQYENVYFREFGALRFNGEVITPRELVQDIDALPFPERARVYMEMSKEYEKSLIRLQGGKERANAES